MFSPGGFDNPPECQCLRLRGVLHYQLYFVLGCESIFFGSTTGVAPARFVVY